MAEFELDYGSPEACGVYHNLDCFTQGYLQAMFFTDTGTGDDGELEYGTFAELAPVALAKIIADCERFQCQHAPLFAHMPPDREEEAGRDFWFTRNGLGAGFWDGDWREPEATTLAKASREFGKLRLCRGGDRCIYLA